jgi:hypothetical protein
MHATEEKNKMVNGRQEEDQKQSKRERYAATAG